MHIHSINACIYIDRDYARGHMGAQRGAGLFLSVLLGAAALAACQAFEGLADDAPATIDGSWQADAGADAPADGGGERRDGAVDPSDAGADASRCITGVGAIDAAYGERPIPHTLLRSLVTPEGVVHSIVRANCAVDGGTNGLALHTIDAGGAATTRGCFGSVEGDAPWAVTLAGGTMYVAATRPSGVLRGRLYAVDVATGGASLVEEHAVAARSVTPSFVVPGGSGAVWGGIEANIGGDTGFLKATGGLPVSTGAEIPLGAAARGADLYVVLYQPSLAAVVARRYTVGAASITEQTAYAAGGRTRVSVSGTPGFGAVASTLVLDGDDLWFAAPVDGVSQGLYVVRPSADVAIAATLAGFIPAYVAQTCDRSILGAVVGSGGEVALSRHGGATPWPKSPRVAGLSVHGFGVDGAGYAYVTVGRGSGSVVLRVAP